jgi:Protein of unknown function (DUF2811)
LAWICAERFWLSGLSTTRLFSDAIVYHLLFREVPVMDMPISLFVEIPETLHQSLATFLDTRPEWDQDRVFSAAISLFLLQNRSADPGSDGQRPPIDQRQTARTYLDALFGDTVFGNSNLNLPKPTSAG